MFHHQAYQQQYSRLSGVYAHHGESQIQHSRNYDKHLAFVKSLLKAIKDNDENKFDPKSQSMIDLANSLQMDKKLSVALVLACCELDRSNILGHLLTLNNYVNTNSKSVNFACACPASPLHPAVHGSCLINVNSSDEDGITGLMVATKKGNTEVVKLLLEINGLKIQATDNYGWTALMYGCYYGSVECVKLLLHAGASVNVYDNDHISCLIWAAGRGYNEIVRLLLKSGAKVDAADKYGTTPLIWACRKGYKEVAETLLEAGANINATGMFGWSALLTTSRGGFVETTKILLNRADINVNTCDAQRLSPLMIASKEGFGEIVQILIDKGAFVNLSDRYGHTALIRAVRGGHLRIVEALIKANADIDHIGFDKKTAIFWAVEKGFVDIAKALLKAKPNLEITTSDGETCLIRAVKSHRQDLVQLLLANNAVVTVTDKCGDTVLHMAVRSQCKSIVELILLSSQKNWSLIYKPNKRKESPFSIDQANSSPIFPKLFEELEKQQLECEQLQARKSPLSPDAQIGNSVVSDSMMSTAASDPGPGQLRGKLSNQLGASFSSLSKFLSAYQFSSSPPLSPTLQLKQQQQRFQQQLDQTNQQKYSISSSSNDSAFGYSPVNNMSSCSSIWLPTAQIPPPNFS